jgi:hypothetical protein
VHAAVASWWLSEKFAGMLVDDAGACAAAWHESGYAAVDAAAASCLLFNTFEMSDFGATFMGVHECNYMANRLRK